MCYDHCGYPIHEIDRDIMWYFYIYILYIKTKNYNSIKPALHSWNCVVTGRIFWKDLVLRSHIKKVLSSAEGPPSQVSASRPSESPGWTAQPRLFIISYSQVLRSSGPPHNQHLQHEPFLGYCGDHQVFNRRQTELGRYWQSRRGLPSGLPPPSQWFLLSGENEILGRRSQ